MKNLRIFAILLLFCLAFSLLTSCAVILGGTGSGTTDSGNTDKTPDDNTGEKEDENNKDPEVCEHLWENGTCVKCQAVCTHNWVSGTCGICNRDCNHTWVGGICSTCGQDCTHLWGDGGICVNCGDECEHNFQNGYCTVCHKMEDPKPDENCEHIWKDGICANCLITCPHEWKEGECLVCGKICEHDFDPKNDYTCTVCGTQAIVPPECNHVWVDGVCTLCKTVCEHDFGFDITCSICGEWLSGSYILLTYNNGEYKVRYESTLAEFISEHLGTTYEATVANGSYWMALDPFNLDKINLEADTPLNQFGACFELYYIDCTPPPVCEHEWVGDYCPKCGRTCDHSYLDSVCTICGTVCSDHYFSYGSCMYCGKPCEHVWGSDYYCINCNSPCEHPELSTYGYCPVCGYECQHYWIIDHCEHCGFHCDHTFDGPTCTKCGYMSGGIDNPLTIYFEDTEYVTPYSASFQELFYLYSDLSYRLGVSDYEESLRYGYWVMVTDQGDVRIGEYTSLCEFGHEMTLAFRRIGEEACSHSNWTDGVCDFCGKVCEHDWSMGHCAICMSICEHSWNNGQCMICFKECEHSFYDGICNVCGFHKEGSDDERVTISLSIQDGIGSDSFSDYTVSVPYSIMLYNLFGADLCTEDGSTLFVPYETNFLVRVNGKAIDHEEFHYTYITGGEHIVIYRCYSFELETVVNGESSYVIYNTPTSVSGAELMYAAGLDPNTNCTIWINGAMFESYTSFADTIFPRFDEYCCFIRFECLDAHAGTVRLEIYEEGYSSGYHEAIGELNISTYVSCGDDFGDFLWTLEYPNGDQVNLETLDMILTFMPDYISSENGASVYKLYRSWNVFWVNLQIDDYCYEAKKFYKSESLTVKDILTAFGFSGEYENYNWMFNSYGGEYIDSLDSNVYSDLSIEAYDSRPYVELVVDGVRYKAYHTTTLTLADAISLINETHGTSITFEDYIWYAYSNDTYRTERVYDPYTYILVEPGYTREATAKTLTQVEVYFTTDFGSINDEIGMQSIIIYKDGTWNAPEIAPYVLEMAGGFVTFTGGFEYRVEEKWEIVARYDVNSIEELFALNLETVTLYAKCEPNYDKICGTYVNYSAILVITESTISRFDKEYGYFGEAKEYKVSISGGYPSLRALDGSFEYMTNILTYEYTKIEDGGFCAVVRMPDGWIEMYTSYDEYLYVTEWSNIDYVTDMDGNALDLVGESGLYFVYTSEKPYVE